ncbi:hypothetical protein STENM327S_03498 [Streptomyces tendae]
MNQQYPDPVVTTAHGPSAGLRRRTRTFLTLPEPLPRPAVLVRPAAAARAGRRAYGGRDPAGTTAPQSARRLGDIDMTPTLAPAAARTTPP